MDIFNQIAAKRKELEGHLSNAIQKSFMNDNIEEDAKPSAEEQIDKAVEDELSGVYAELGLVEKATYADTAENRKLGRVGQEYTRKKQDGGKTEHLKLLQKTPNKQSYHHFEQMSDNELSQFIKTADRLSYDHINLNRLARQNVKQWVELAREEKRGRKPSRQKNYIDLDPDGGYTEIQHHEGGFTTAKDKRGNWVVSGEAVGGAYHTRNYTGSIGGTYMTEHGERVKGTYKLTFGKDKKRSDIVALVKKYAKKSDLTKKGNEDELSNVYAELGLEKARSGTYADTAKNRKLNRVGQQYGSEKGVMHGVKPKSRTHKQQQATKRAIQAPRKADGSLNEIYELEFEPDPKESNDHETGYSITEPSGRYKAVIGKSFGTTNTWLLMIRDNGIGKHWDKFTSKKKAQEAAYKKLTELTSGSDNTNKADSDELNTVYEELFGKAEDNDKVGIVMDEFKQGKLKTSSGKKVKDKKQALAIALSEQEREDVKKAEEVLMSAGFDTELFEKAKHQVGERHPQHPEWLWTEWRPGKFDWKSENGPHHKGKAKATASSSQNSKAQLSSLDDYVKQKKAALARPKTTEQKEIEAALSKEFGNASLSTHGYIHQGTSVTLTANADGSCSVIIGDRGASIIDRVNKIAEKFSMSSEYDKKESDSTSSSFILRKKPIDDNSRKNGPSGKDVSLTAPKTSQDTPGELVLNQLKRGSATPSVLANLMLHGGTQQQIDEAKKQISSVINGSTDESLIDSTLKSAKGSLKSRADKAKPAFQYVIDECKKRKKFLGTEAGKFQKIIFDKLDYYGGVEAKKHFVADSKGLRRKGQNMYLEVETSDMKVSEKRDFERALKKMEDAGICHVTEATGHSTAIMLPRENKE